MLKRWKALPSSTQWLIGVLAAVVLALAIGWVLFVPAADWLAHHDLGSAKVPSPQTTPSLQTARDAARGRLLTLSAGLLAAGALVFTARNFWLSREGQLTDRYSKAVEQLGSDKSIEVRIGGIYALERIARDSEKYHQTVMEVLAAFIRNYSKEQRREGPRARRSTRGDVQAALIVVGRRQVKNDSIPIDLYGAILINANLNGANLSGVTLRHANLTKAVLLDAILAGADLRDAKLKGARLDRADFTHAKWSEDAPEPPGWKRVEGRHRRYRLERADRPSSTTTRRASASG